jgi:predicted permease
MRTDVLHLVRSLRRSPISAAAAVVTLALTIGVGASIFAVVDAILLTPPPFVAPETLVLLGERPLDERVAAAPRAVPFGTFESWRGRAGALASLEAFDGTNVTLTGVGDALRLSANDTTPGFLRLLGVSPIAGRLFEADDIAQPVVIVSHEFWRTTLASDPAMVGRPLVLGGRTHTIVGVLPERFTFGFNRSDLWRPLPITVNDAARTGYRVLAMARLGDGTSPMQLASALDDVSRQSRPPSSVVATPVATAIVGNRRQTLGLLAGGAAVAVLIAFINLAGLLVVRTIDRRRELAVRSALGARRVEIMRQVLFEAVALVAAGTGVGVLIAWWMTPVVERLTLQQFGAIANREIAMSWRVIGVVAGAALVCALISGWLPAVQTARRRAIDVLRRGVTSSPRDRRVSRLFVGGEVALAFVLLMSMTLLGRTLVDLLRVNPGFEPRGVLEMALALPRAVYPGAEQVASFYVTLQAALQDRLGAQTVSVVDELPLTHDRGRVVVSARADGAGREAVLRTVNPGYFGVMRIPVSAGRAFALQDDARAPRRIVVSQSLAARLFPNEQPTGRHVRFGRDAELVEIIGVVGDVKHRALDEPPFPTVYQSGLQDPSPGSRLVVRSPRADADTIAVVRAEVALLDPNLPVYGVRTMEEVLSDSAGMPARRLLTAVFTGFALLAVVLSAVGMFGVAAHDVASRRLELALRLALGANPMRLVRTTLGQGAVVVGAGLLVGGLLSLWSAQALSGLVVGSGRMDPLSSGIAGAVLLVAGMAAVLPAALRAARTDPLLTLRSE